MAEVSLFETIANYRGICFQHALFQWQILLEDPGNERIKVTQIYRLLLVVFFLAFSLIKNKIYGRE